MKSKQYYCISIVYLDISICYLYTCITYVVDSTNRTNPKFNLFLENYVQFLAYFNWAPNVGKSLQ